MGMRAEHSKGPSASARAEAAAWVARLHGPNRTKEVEAGLRHWLADDPQNPVAFELMTETWDTAARLQRRPIERITSWEIVGFRLSFSRAAIVLLATAACAVFGTLFYLHSDGITTGIGELRTIRLQDGTRIFMDSNTQLLVRYGKAQRQVRLVRGEAFFEVTKNPDRPFIVKADGHVIKDLGTEFDVLSDPHRFAVTLVEGKVTVSPLSERDGGKPPMASTGPSRSATPLSNRAQTFTLSAGERLTFSSNGVPKLDRPPVEIVTAWERGQVVFDNTSLSDAVSQMNRYSRQKLVLEGSSGSGIRVSGLFQAGDSQNFAAAVAKTYHIRVSQRDGAIVLTPSEQAKD